jgi:hypothetical protein
MTAMTFPMRLVWCGVDLGLVLSEQHGAETIARHQAACIGEGICPVHRRGLALAPHVGFCATCSKVWHADSASVGWHATDARGDLL